MMRILSALPSSAPTGRSRTGTRFPYIMVSPALLLLVVVLGIPIARAIWLSMQNVRLNRPQEFEGFLGFANYTRMLQDADFWAALSRSTLYTLGSVFLSFVLGYISALVVNTHFRGRGFLRSALILPWAIPLVAGTLVWAVMLDGNFGILNWLIERAPGSFGGVQWLLDTRTALATTIVVDAWHHFPVAMLFILAGLQSIPKELYEASAMDGASPIKQFIHVTLPEMRYINFTLLLLLTIYTFKRFDVIFILTQGGPVTASQTLILQTYDEAFKFYNFSYGATLGVATLVIGLAFTAVHLVALRRGAS